MSNYLLAQSPMSLSRQISSLRKQLELSRVLIKIWRKVFDTEFRDGYSIALIKICPKTDIVTLVNVDGVEKELGIDLSKLVRGKM